MVLGQLPLMRIASNPKTNPNPGRGDIFLEGNCPDTFPHHCNCNVTFIFTKRAFTYYAITEGRGGVVSKILVHNFGVGVEVGLWHKQISFFTKTNSFETRNNIYLCHNNSFHSFSWFSTRSICCFIKAYNVFFISDVCEQLLGQHDFFKQLLDRNELIFMLHLDRI